MSENAFFKLLINCIMISSLISSSYSICDFKGIFNFGDSNSDTGGFDSAFPAQPGPYGMTYFKKPVGRSSDGRLIVDFLGNRSIFIILCVYFVFYRFPQPNAILFEVLPHTKCKHVSQSRFKH